MKTFSKLAAITIILFMTVSQQVYAETFKTKTEVTADDNGIVTITGGDGIVALTQYCPDEEVDGCGNNISIERVGNSFTLDKEGLTNHQNVFNFNNSSGGWLLIPDPHNVIAGNNIDIVRSKKGGAYFLYKGLIPKQ